MPRMKLYLSLVIMVMALALVGGATMAWFTDATEPLVNEFEAGTVEIDAGGKTRFPNWNPGDEDEAKFCVTNNGSKKVNVRLNFEDAGWNPGPLRILVLYTGTDIQLIGVEWSTFCQGCTGEEGHLASATANYGYSSSPHPDGGGQVLNTDSYFTVNFSDIAAGNDRLQSEVERWLSSGDNTNPFTGWCLDSGVTISPGNYSVKIFDPFCNENWVEETDASGALKTRWENIDFDKISYMINHDFLSRGYLSIEVQQAIWMYTNGSYHVPRYYVGDASEINSYIDNIAAGYGGDIVAALNAIDNVNWNMVRWEIKEGENVVESGDSSADWVEDEDIFYFKAHDLEPGQTLCLYLKVKLDGTKTGNIYQGVNYVFKGFFEAVQSSNFAPFYEWEVDYYGTPTP